MPFVRVGEDDEAVDLYYHIYEDQPYRRNGQDGEDSSSATSLSVLEGSPPQQNGRYHQPLRDNAHQLLRDKPRVVLIMGFAAGQGAWTPQLHGLLHPAKAEHGTSVTVLTMDNRGVGKSSCPRAKAAYRTAIMAQDILKLMDHLQWETAHIVGHSMGGMIAMKLAVLAPQRVCSLSIVSATGGGWQSLPFSWRAAKYMWKAYRAGNGKERAQVDLKFHFMRETLRQYVLGRRRKEMLLEEYTGVPDAGADKPPGQPKWAMQGQLSAIWHHSISATEFALLKRASFRRQVIHGRYDILAAPKHAEALAKKMCCRLVMLEGAHFITRECGTELNSLLRAIIFPAQSLDPQHYMATAAESDVVSSLRAPSQELEAAVELVATGRQVANGLWPESKPGSGVDGVDSSQVSGESPTAASTIGSSSTGSNLALLGVGKSPNSRCGKMS